MLALPPNPDSLISREKAELFLLALDPEAEGFTFQTFTDSKQARESRKSANTRDPLARILHGSLEQHWSTLVELSATGAGIYVAINKTDFCGRSASNIVSVRAYFVDLDGAPPANLRRLGLSPHLFTKTSRGRFQAFWRVAGGRLETFSDTQRRLAALLGGDPNVSDLPRVMRLPGFPHQKQQPSQVDFVVKNVSPYREADFQKTLAGAEVSQTLHGDRRRLGVTSITGIAAPTDMTQGFPDGQRTHELTRRAGWCLGPACNMTEAQAIVACLDWNRHNNPPLSDEKVSSTVASIARAEARKRVPDAQPVDILPCAAIAAASEPNITFQRLAILPPYEYDRLRAQEAERLGVRVGTLDAEVDKFRPVTDPGLGAGRPLTLPSPEPWIVPVQGTELLKEIATALRRYVVLPPEAIVAVTLFVVYAHAFEAWSISPRLAITSPEMQCGKTTLLSVIESIVPRALKADNVTAAAVFRVVEQARPTLLIDEADSFLKDNEELRGVLNSGHRRNGQVIRLVGDNHEARVFSTWCPTMIAAIGRIPSTLEDRSISISMRRALQEEVVIRFDENERAALAPLGRKARRWADDHMELLRSADPQVPDELHGRAADNWRPLLAVAEVVGTPWSSLARNAAIKLTLHKSADHESVRIQLLADIRALFEDRNVERFPSGEMVQALCSLEGRPWQDWGKGRPMTTNQLARQLAPFGVKPKTMRVGKEQPSKGYERSAFNDAFARYLAVLKPSANP